MSAASCFLHNADVKHTNKQQNKALHPTAYASVVPPYAAAAGELGVVPARAAWLRALCNNVSMRISELNGDSTVSGVVFSSGQIKCRFEDGETDEEYSISIPSQLLYSQGSSESGSVHVRLIELAGVLPIEAKSQIYLAPQEFGAQMQAAREGFMLAVGLKSTEWPLFLQIRGYRVLVACPIQSEESICVQPLK